MSGFFIIFYLLFFVQCLLNYTMCYFVELLDRAFCKFNNSSIVQMTRLSSHLNILELFHGPTLAFKDLAMLCVGQFLEYFLAKRKKHMTVLVCKFSSFTTIGNILLNKTNL